MEGGGEMSNLIKVWLTVFVSLCYCYFISKNVPKGVTRLLTILPIVCLLLILPLNLTTTQLSGITGFFLAWLANFKLLLFAFDKGPLSSDPSISLARFLAVGCLPIKIHHPSQNSDHPIFSKTPQNGLNSPLNYAIKLLLLAMLLRVYDYSEYIHPTVILILYCFHIYFALEIILATVAAMARTILGFELEPQFDDPYLSTSLQDFWGRRWNLMVSNILRPTVYEPVVHLCARPMGRKWAQLYGVLMTFVVSGVMHELMFYYLGRQMPTGEVTWFFLLHGVCLMIEIVVKKGFKGRFQVPRLISGIFTVGFVMFTSLWLFFPQLIRCKVDQKALEEYAAIGAYLKNIGRALILI